MRARSIWASDIQVSITDVTCASLRNLINAVSAHISGFEADMIAKLSDGLQVNANLGHVKTRYDEFTPNLGNDRSSAGFGTSPT